jgi:hypothetical protein
MQEPTQRAKLIKFLTPVHEPMLVVAVAGWALGGNEGIIGN